MKQQVKEFMLKKRREAKSGKLKDEVLEDDTLETTSAEVATGAMKFALLATPPRHEVYFPFLPFLLLPFLFLSYPLFLTNKISIEQQIKFDIEKTADPEANGNAPFVLYNATRLISLFRNYEDGVKANLYPPLPPIDEVDFSILNPTEWSLLIEYILYFPSLVLSVATPEMPPAPQLPDFSTNKVPPPPSSPLLSSSPSSSSLLLLPLFFFFPSSSISAISIS